MQRPATDRFVATDVVIWLRERQHPAGSWSDFSLAGETSDAWVTAYVGFALAEAARRLPATTRSVAAAAADAAAGWLLANEHLDGGWGYSGRTSPDADSTAWAVRLLAARNLAVPGRAVELLDAHAGRTFRGTVGRWSEPTPDVTAVWLLAKYETGLITQAELARLWESRIGSADSWSSLWWKSTSYPTAIVAEAWKASGRPAEQRVWPDALTVFGQALAALSGDGDLAGVLAARLGSGGWRGDADLVMPSRADGPALTSVDARGLFTTATVLRALLAQPAAGRAPVHGRDTAYDVLVGDLAADLGLDADEQVAVFQSLTRESLARGTPWPSQQLSTLASGLPLELSVASRPGLRYAVETGDAGLPPYKRLVSGLGAMERTAELLGVSRPWRTAVAAAGELIAPDLPVPEGRTFWLWAAVDATARGTALKAYLSLHAADVPDARGRLMRTLTAFGVPSGAVVFDVIERLERVGFCHEFGFGMTPDGRIGAKVYYDLRGWRPELVGAVLSDVGLPSDPAAVCPEIPGVLRASLAAKQRAGIALRVNLRDGSVPELTVAAELPPALVDVSELARRISRWLRAEGNDPAAFDRITAQLLPAWRRDPARKLHSMFTRTRSRTAVTNTVYLRPAFCRTESS